VIFELLFDIVDLSDSINLLIVSFLGVKTDVECRKFPFFINLADLFFILELMHGFSTNIIDQILVVMELKLKYLLKSDSLKINWFRLFAGLLDNSIPMSFLNSRVT
jgi:hypothetical protein